MRKFFVALCCCLCVGAGIFFFWGQKSDQKPNPFLVFVDVPTNSVTTDSAVVTWYWTKERPEPKGIQDYNLYIEDWEAGGTNDWNYGPPDAPQEALLYKTSTSPVEKRHQCTITGLQDDTYYHVYLEPVLEDGTKLPRSMLEFATPKAGENIYPLEYGVFGDGRGDDTEMLQRIINLCPPGGTVVLKRGLYKTGPLRLHGQMTLKLRAGAVLEALPQATKNPVAVLPIENTPLALLNCKGGHDLRISGQGMILAGDYPLLACTNSKNIYLQALTLQQKTPQAKAIVLNACQGVSVNAVTFNDFLPQSVNLINCTDILTAKLFAEVLQLE
jgi:hypothetical protein